MWILVIPINSRELTQISQIPMIPCKSKWIWLNLMHPYKSPSILVNPMIPHEFDKFLWILKSPHGSSQTPIISRKLIQVNLNKFHESLSIPTISSEFLWFLMHPSEFDKISCILIYSHNTSWFSMIPHASLQFLMNLCDSLQFPTIPHKYPQFLMHPHN